MEEWILVRELPENKVTRSRQVKGTAPTPVFLGLKDNKSTCFKAVSMIERQLQEEGS